MAAVCGKHEDSAAAPSKTVFIRNLPFDTDNQQLEEVFSDIGPIKGAFVVKDTDNASKCRGFGYVQFVLQDDADKAIKSLKSIRNRKLKICYANKKPKHEKRKKEQGNDENEKWNIEQKEGDADADDKSDSRMKEIHGAKKEEANKQLDMKSEYSKDKTDLQRTIVLTGLTQKVKRKAFRVMCEKFGEIENIVYPVPERTEVTAFVRFKDYKSTIRAVQKLPGQKVKKSKALSAVLLTKEGKFPSKKTLRQSRLIVRNLSFKCDENDLRECFSKFGKVINVNIPTKVIKNKTVKLGCAFVQFDNPIHAKAAINEMNLKEIKERAVVIDWAVDKQTYDEKKEKKEVTSELVETETSKKKEIVVKKEKKKKSTETDEDDSNDDADSNNTDEGNINEGNNSVEVESEEEESENENEDEMDTEIDSDEEEETKEQKPKKELKDAKEGKTIFIRNLSYNTEEEDLAEEFEKYGEIEYCKIVIDPETGHSRGSAFIKFMQKQSADDCIKEISHLEEREKNVVIDGRSIVVSLAVTRGKVTEIKRQQSENKQETDKRNLYLAYEGVITKNSPGGDGLSDADLKRREKALAEKKAKLKNPNYFVSRTRLCIRNLPLSTDANELRHLLSEQLSKPVKMKEVKIMRNKERNDPSGQPRSLGYGFIDVDTHENAIALLRATNNNPDIFGEKRRPIVEFSVENAKALKILEQRKQKNEQKIRQMSEDKDQNEILSSSTNTLGTLSSSTNKIGKKSLQEKMREQKKKRIVRYKRKKERKKAKQNNEIEQTVQKDEKNNMMSKQTVQKDEKNNMTSQQIHKPENGSVHIKTKLKRKKSDVNEWNTKRSRKVEERNNRNEEAKFNVLVDQYKVKFFGSATKKREKKGSRWFE